MSNYSALIASIRAVIKENHREEITGPILQAALLSMVSSLGDGYQFVGLATPTSDPGTPDERVFYLATTAGTYANYGSITVADGEVAVLAYDTAWSKKAAWGVGGLSLAQMWASLDNTEADDFADVQIAAAHLVGYITEDSLANTLQDYVRQSAFGALSDTLASHETRLTDLEGLVADGALGGGASVDWFVEESYVVDGETRRRLKLNPAYAGLYANGWIVAGGIGTDSGQQGGSLASLSDVDFGTLANGDIIRYDALTSHWVNVSLALSLGQLTDVTLGAPSDGQALVYDSTNQVWKPGTVGGGGVEVISYDATIGTSLTTLGTIDGTPIKAKIAAYLTQAVADGRYGAGFNNASGKLYLVDVNGNVLDTILGADLATAIGNNAVAEAVKATKDGNGNTISSTYLTAHQTVTLASGTNNGTLKLTTAAGTTDNIAVTGLGSLAFLSSVAWSNIGGTPTTLSGYGITDAKFGTAGTDSIPITLGSTTQSVLTAHQSLSGYLSLATADGRYAAAFNYGGGKLYLENKDGNVISTLQGSELVQYVIVDNAVNRATADASGNTFTTSYLRKNTDDTMSANLTIGSSSSPKNLTIYGGNSSSAPALTIRGGTQMSHIWRDSNGLNIFSSLAVDGNITATGNIVAGSASDRRLKRDIATMSYGSAERVLAALRPVTFEWSEKAGELGNLKGVSRGFIADEFNEIIINATRKIWENYDAIDYEQVIPYLVAGWQAQRARIKSLEGEIANIKLRLGYGV